MVRSDKLTLIVIKKIISTANVKKLQKRYSPMKNYWPLWHKSALYQLHQSNTTIISIKPNNRKPNTKATNTPNKKKTVARHYTISPAGKDRMHALKISTYDSLEG